MNDLEIYMQHPFVMQRIREERKKQWYDEDSKLYLDGDGFISFEDTEYELDFKWDMSVEGSGIWFEVFRFKNFAPFYKFHGIPEPKTIQLINPINASEARASYIGKEDDEVQMPLLPINEVYQMIHENMKHCTEIQCRVQLETIEIKLLELRGYKVERIGDRVKVSW